MAERTGFEPARLLHQHDFQSCAIDRTRPSLHDMNFSEIYYTKELMKKQVFFKIYFFILNSVIKSRFLDAFTYGLKRIEPLRSPKNNHKILKGGVILADQINVHSEIGKLKRVMLHRPGKELENLMPEYLDRLLFDDIPYLKTAQEEHDAFAELLRAQGAEVVYLTDLVAESILDADIKEQFISDFIRETEVRSSWELDFLTDYFKSKPTKEMVDEMCAGVRKSAVKEHESSSLSSLLKILDDDYPFLIDPMPNLYFTRDPFASVGNGVTIHKMRTKTRTRESLFAKYIFTYHPMYKDTRIWYDRTEDSSLEGGDILILNEKTIAFGISQRTHENAIEKFANEILGEKTTFEKVLAFNIPKERSFMHLDTVFTMVDHNKFTIHPNIVDQIMVFVIHRDSNGKIRIQQEQSDLEDILKKYLELDEITLLRCGSDSKVDSSREQWSDGSNTLAIAPGEVVVYARNYLTNEILEENGIKTHVIKCSELSRGRGGPRCMSMPLIREPM